MADAVNQLHDLRAQLKERNAALATNAAAKDLVGMAAALTNKFDSLEARIHNPAAEVTYDILAQRGGSRLYSRLVPVYMWVVTADGLPTQGMKEVFADQRKELDGYLAELRVLIEKDLTAINARASQLSIGHVIVPNATPTPIP
jgi:hypothetical protein